jgi:ATP-dependent Clp protease ATP-binding subunit ClpB
VREIVEIQFKNIAALMLKNNGIEMEATPDAIDWLSQLGYDPQFGARPLKRVLQKKLLNELSRMIMSGSIDKSKKIIVDSFNGQIVFRN